MSDKTIFEKLVAKEIPCHEIYQDETTFAFLDINPVQFGHALVIPKKPFKNIYEIPAEVLGPLFQTVQKIAVAVKKATNAEGINIVMNNEPSAGQVVFHAHIHVIPRFENDGGYHKRGQKYQEGQAEMLVQKIRENLS